MPFPLSPRKAFCSLLNLRLRGSRFPLVCGPSSHGSLQDPLLFLCMYACMYVCVLFRSHIPSPTNSHSNVFPGCSYKIIIVL